MADFTIVRSSITIVFRAKSSIMETFAEVRAQRRHAPYLLRGVFPFFLKSTRKESSAGRKSLPPIRETMAQFFLSRRDR